MLPHSDLHVADRVKLPSWKAVAVYNVSIANNNVWAIVVEKDAQHLAFTGDLQLQPLSSVFFLFSLPLFFSPSLFIPLPPTASILSFPGHTAQQSFTVPDAMSVPLPLPPSGVDDAAIRNLLRFFPKYRIGQTTPEVRGRGRSPFAERAQGVRRGIRIDRRQMRS